MNHTKQAFHILFVSSSGHRASYNRINNEYGTRRNAADYDLISCTIPAFAKGTRENYEGPVAVANVPAET
jgi:hypothetical protein